MALFVSIARARAAESGRFMRNLFTRVLGKLWMDYVAESGILSFLVGGRLNV